MTYCVLVVSHGYGAPMGHPRIRMRHFRWPGDDAIDEAVSTLRPLPNGTSLDLALELCADRFSAFALPAS